jgi:hypothetical protein
MRSNNNNKLKAFVRFDGSGRIIPGSLNVQSIKPKDGNWRQINAKECCLNNECSAAAYGGDWIVNDVTEVNDGIIFQLLTNPFENFTIQAQMVDCITGNGVGEIATIGPATGNELNWFVPTSILSQTCAIQVRHVCGPDFYSGWTYWD